MVAGLTFLCIIALTFVQTKQKAQLDEDMYLYWRRSEPGECEPFTSQMIDCNKCVCSADKISYCTRMACSSKGHNNLDASDGKHRRRRSSTKKVRDLATKILKASLMKIDSREIQE